MAVLQGLGQLDQKLKQIELSVQRKMLTNSLRDAAELARAKAAELAPILSGRLKGNEIISRVTSQSSAQTAVVRVGPGRKTFYGLFDEIGTAFMTARPFLGPAYEETKDAVLAKTAVDFKAAVENYGR